ncbi:DUF4177 domain-containing protein [Bacillus timonensis]|nr:DUF4177 domain-containing protein [Bacillus timonensis]
MAKSVVEYKTIKIKPEARLTKLDMNIERADEQLNLLGQEGWKLVSTHTIELTGVTNGIYYTFMREKE